MRSATLRAADPASAATILDTATPEGFNALLGFGPDGYLWFSIGDDLGVGDCDAQAMSPYEFRKSVSRAGRTGQDRLIVEVPLDFQGHTVGGFVAAVAVLVQALHHDPVEIATELARQ